MHLIINAVSNNVRMNRLQALQHLLKRRNAKDRGQNCA
jgi:hypothetical protein